VATIAGIQLLFSGIVAIFIDIELPFASFGAYLIIERLGRLAAVLLGLGGGALSLYHGLRSIRNRPSRRFTLPPTYLFWLVFAVVLGLGNVVLVFGIADEFLFPPLFLLGAALPTLAVLAWTGRRLGWPSTWRQTALSFVSGSTLSIIVTLLLGAVLPFIVYLLLEPLLYSFYDILDTPLILISPEVLFFVLFTVLQAPLPEEFAKALGPGLMGMRVRIKTERQAFLIGMASGAGFAILENMLYEGLYASWSGWTWGGITLLRGIGVVLHPIGTGIIALALFRARHRGKGWFGQLFRAYVLSVGLHTLWNGGFDLFLYYTGLGWYGLSDVHELSFYGEPISLLLIVFLLVLSAGLWWLLRRYVTTLSKEEAPAMTPQVVSPRALALWAGACALVIIPIGIVMGQVWEQIKAAVLGG
jgi:RsiW-degrading membrane proteinase PrsW (M82 family)